MRVPSIFVGDTVELKTQAGLGNTATVARIAVPTYKNPEQKEVAFLVYTKSVGRGRQRGRQRWQAYLDDLQHVCICPPATMRGKQKFAPRSAECALHGERAAS